MVSTVYDFNVKTYNTSNYNYGQVKWASLLFKNANEGTKHVSWV